MLGYGKKKKLFPNLHTIPSPPASQYYLLLGTYLARVRPVHTVASKRSKTTQLFAFLNSRHGFINIRWQSFGRKAKILKSVFAVLMKSHFVAPGKA